MSFVNASTGYGCTSSGKVVKTTNGGVNWGFQNTPLTEILNGIQFISENTGYVASWTGKVLKTTNGGLTFTSQTSSEVPRNFELGQNFPNPFNPSTNIPYELKEPSHLTLKVYDVQGKEVKELVNGRWGTGKFIAYFEGTEFSTGVYFYKIVLYGESSKQTFSETKRMLLVK